jgi:hypothetical protein
LHFSGIFITKNFWTIYKLKKLCIFLEYLLPYNSSGQYIQYTSGRIFASFFDYLLPHNISGQYSVRISYNSHIRITACVGVRSKNKNVVFNIINYELGLTQTSDMGGEGIGQTHGHMHGYNYIKRLSFFVDMKETTKAKNITSASVFILFSIRNTH